VTIHGDNFGVGDPDPTVAFIKDGYVFLASYCIQLHFSTRNLHLLYLERRKIVPMSNFLRVKAHKLHAFYLKGTVRAGQCA
jgi:hypothetical protein